MVVPVLDDKDRGRNKSAEEASHGVMAADSTPVGLSLADAPATVDAPRSRRRSRALVLAFALCLAILGAISMSGVAPSVNAALPHSLRAVIGEGCGGG